MLQSPDANLRFLLGLVGNSTDRKETQVHNEANPDPVKNTISLNKNVAEWLLGTVQIPNDDDDRDIHRPDTFSIHSRYLRALLAPNYTVFSNIDSQEQWISDNIMSSSSHYVRSEERRVGKECLE